MRQGYIGLVEIPNWKHQLNNVFSELERRQTVAAMRQPLDKAEFEKFIAAVAIPAFREFKQALAEHGDHPDYNDGPDWVGLRWPDGHAIFINSLFRAPNRAAATTDRVRARRSKADQPPLGEAITNLLQMSEEDLMEWLVYSYAAYRRVSETEIEYPAEFTAKRSDDSAEPAKPAH